MVTYAVGGLQESVVDGLTGLHVRPGDVTELARALRRVCLERPLRERLSAAAVNRVHAYYTWDRTASLLAETYASARVPVLTEGVTS